MKERCRAGIYIEDNDIHCTKERSHKGEHKGGITVETQSDPFIVEYTINVKWTMGSKPL